MVFSKFVQKKFIFYVSHKGAPSVLCNLTECAFLRRFSPRFGKRRRFPCLFCVHFSPGLRSAAPLPRYPKRQAKPNIRRKTPPIAPFAPQHTGRPSRQTRQPTSPSIHPLDILYNNEGFCRSAAFRAKLCINQQLSFTIVVAIFEARRLRHHFPPLCG
jgi:hypothetical protein